MKLPVFKKKEEIPAAFLELYEEKDGEWHPKEEAPDADSDVGKLKETLKKEREGREKAEKELKAEKKRLEQEAADLERKKQGVTEAQLKSIREEVRKEIEAEYEPSKKELEAIKKDNRSLRLDSAVKTLMGKAGVRSDRQEALWRLIGDDFDLTDDGKPMVKSSPGTEVAKYLADNAKKLYPEFYEGTKAAGGGAGGQGGGGTAAAPATPGGAPKVEDILANPAQAMRQAREAGVKT